MNKLIRLLLMLFLNINKSLTCKLVIAISIFILVGSGLIWQFSIHNLRQNLMKDAISTIIAFSELTQKSIKHDMLSAEMEDIQEALQSLGTLESIKKVRILNNTGVISHSSDHSERGKKINWNSFPCLHCHQDHPLEQNFLTHKRQWIKYQDDEGHYILTLLDPILNEPDCNNTSACHIHPRNEKIIGLLISDSPLDPLEKRITENIFSITILIICVVTAIAIILSIILWLIVIKPITALSEGMKRVSAGDLTHKVAFSKDDVGRLSFTFNEMTEELSQARKKMEEWTQSLEKEVEKKTRLIKETQDKLIQAEKFAALGRLTGEIAHVIRNPLTALGGFGRRLLNETLTDKQRRYVSIIVSEADRLENILKDVLIYSWEPHLQFARIELSEIIEETILLVTELCEDYSIKIERRYATNLPVLVEKEHVQQAVLNLISNAIDVMSGGGTLTVYIDEEEKNKTTYVVVHISDTGPGIPEEEIFHVMEPFFSTKKIGHGTGLGLSISRKILYEHGGFIQLTNRTSGGLTASLYFPYQSAEELAKIPCWEFMQCGRNKDSSKKCSAYPHFGRVCWAVAGTLCAGKIQGTFAQKIDDCKECKFYHSISIS